MSAYGRPAGLLVRRCPDRVLVLAGERVHTLEATAIDLFDAIATPVELGVVVDRVARRYDGVSAAAVLEGLEALLAVGLAERVGA